MDIVKRRIDKILKAGANVVRTTGGIDDLCFKLFTEVGVMAVKRCKKERISDDELITIKKTGARSAASIILRGANDVMLDEMERSVHDALCVCRRVLESRNVVCGGGAVEAALNVYLEAFATSLASREQLPMAAFADALLVIPKTLAKNAAKDSISLCVTAACAIANIVKSSLGLNKMLVDDARCARRRPMRSPTPDALPDARRVRRCRTRSPMPDAFADAGRLFLLLLGVLASRGLRRSDVLLFIRFRASVPYDQSSLGMVKARRTHRLCAFVVVAFCALGVLFYLDFRVSYFIQADYVKLIDSSLLRHVHPALVREILSVPKKIPVAPKAVPLDDHNPAHAVGIDEEQALNLSTIPELNDDTLAFRLAVQKIEEGFNATKHFDPFPYLVKPKLCSEDGPVPPVIFYVTVPPGPDDIVTRALIRNTWGRDARARGFGVLFAMGRHAVALEHNHTSDVEVALSENALYGDILMANFRDSWEHLIHKWWATTHFHAHHCRDVPLMAFTDADTVIFAENFDRFLVKNAHRFDEKIGCTTIGGQPPERGELSRYYVPPKLWPSSRLPSYCSGTLQIYSSVTAQRLSKGVLELGIEYVTSFKIFDVVTGPVAKIAGVELSNVQEIRSWLPNVDICRDDIIAQHGIKPATIIPVFLDYRQRCCSAVMDNMCPYNGTVPEKIAYQTRRPFGMLSAKRIVKS
ncbi:hypothetical protein QR680_000416 [Steinernema hermaphroditum]|uniref:T-complex protein 1 subunit alpha n=1 Tax=Steinernema hermaphroditum TaxID=289476 RepID=A0AA39LE87_9BILA|nr:hypothetical protein QR680_000416 [Steinernema hermaphroditum]